MSRPKVFFIGFNKTATTSFDYLFKHSGYRTYHSLDSKGFSLAATMHSNYKNGKRMLVGIDDADCYSDLTFSSYQRYIEANEYFKELDNEYPNSYFILQTRNMDDWIESRLNHSDKDSFLERCITVLHCNKQDVIRRWKDLKIAHFSNVRRYFQDHTRFLEFNIDIDDISKLIDHVSPHYVLNAGRWKRLNVTREQQI